jgi:murein DD-endopeptidase MepM/ murein hydrolase activator NlpD
MYLALFQARGRDLLDELRAAMKDLAVAREELEQARADALQRVDAERRQAELLATARTTHAKAQDALKSRIADLLEESRQLAAQEAQIQAILRRASRSNGGVSKAGLIWPLNGAVTSEFGPRWGLFHAGIDIAAPAGSAIKAAKAGTVIYAGNEGGYGNFVIIDHGGGLATAYAHMSSIAMREGQRVSQGQTVGTVGSTGHSTGPHLHFEVRVDGVAKNPRAYLP